MNLGVPFNHRSTGVEHYRILQDSLNQVVKLNLPLPRNSFYGSQTEAAVRQFQQLFDLPVTGIASLEVRSKLDQAAKRIAK